MQIPSFAGSTNDIYFFMACIYISWWSDFMEEYQLENYRIFHHVNKNVTCYDATIQAV